MTAGLQALTDAARNTLQVLVPLQYKTHIIQSPSSVKQPTSLTLGAGVDYLQHAFDHILTAGFVSERAAAVFDIIAPALAALVVAPANTNSYRAFYKRWYKGVGGAITTRASAITCRATLPSRFKVWATRSRFPLAFRA